MIRYIILADEGDLGMWPLRVDGTTDLWGGPVATFPTPEAAENALAVHSYDRGLAFPVEFP